MRLIVGLGNPGSKYAGNRHNIGFMAIDAIADRVNAGPWKAKFKGELAEATIAGEKTFLLKPQTMMNLSGESVGEAARFYKIAFDDIIVFYDELDLAPGKVRTKRGGGSGGHNGIKSIDAHCGTNYLKVRLGIGHPGDKNLVTPHVLGDFAKADRDWLDPLLEAIGKYIGLLVKGEDSTFMNRLVAPTGGKEQPTGAPKKTKKPASKGQSHIHQARRNKPAVEPPKTGPMAEMLKKLLGKGE